MLCPFARRVLVALVAVPGAGIGAQAATDDSVASPRLLFVGGNAEDRRRTDQLVGKTSSAGFLSRTASVLADTTPLSWREFRLRVIQPYVDLTWNSTIPFSLNDGAEWAGRGLTFSASAGFAARIGRVSLNVTPMIWHAENKSTPVLPAGESLRKGFSSPWQTGFLSADIPLRFGYRSTTAVDYGESAVWITARGVATGLSNESQWWGPGIRNALLMSNNAGGIPHAFLRTATPVRTRFGDIEGRWIIGGLTESRFFDVNPSNNLRSLSGAVVTFAPANEPNLTAGIARVVYANVHGVIAMPVRSLDVFARWGDWSNIRKVNRRAAEQITALFGRWVFPQSGAEVYGEWARLIGPSSLRSLLVAPQYSQGFTVGLQKVTQAMGARYRVQLEMTNLEQSPKTRDADTVSFYASRAVPQGYTQRGQVVGASIGPGSSSQWFAIDRLSRRFDVGVFAGRIRWNTDAYYTRSTSLAYFSYDVSVFSGVRASVRTFGREVTAEYWAQRRLNYLFQNSLDGYSLGTEFDRPNVTFRLRVQ
jgi:hypothetical protein